MDKTFAKANQNNAFSNDENGKGLDPLEIWKQIYFLNEKSWINLVNTTMATDSYPKKMTQFMDNYLDFEKMVRKGMDHYFGSIPVPSKKDIARVAKLVIGVEDKIDDLETNVEKNMGRLIGNISQLIDNIYQEKQKRSHQEAEINSVKKSLDCLNQSLYLLNDKIEKLSAKVEVIDAPKNKTEEAKRTRSQSRKKQPEEKAKKTVNKNEPLQGQEELFTTE